MNESDLPDDAETAVASDEADQPNTPADETQAEAQVDPEAEALAEAEQLHGDPVVDPVVEQRQEAARGPKAGLLNPKDDPSVGTMTYGKGMPHARS